MREEILESPRISGYAFNIPIVRDEETCIGVQRLCGSVHE